MRTIQMTLDDDLVAAVDGIVKNLKQPVLLLHARH